MKLIELICKRLSILTALALTLSSCSMMTEDEPDCNPYFKVRFEFERNILFHDAFSSQVSEVDLYVLDDAGNIIWQGHEEGEKLAQEGYLMDLPVAPGKYDLVAWCRKRHENAEDFTLSGGNEPKTFSDLRMTLNRKHDSHTAYNDTDIHALFHGILTDVELPDTWGTHIVKVPLTKDTNSIRIMLVHLDGTPISKDDFDFKITDRNGSMDSDNRLLDDEPIEYRAWAKREGIASLSAPDNNSQGETADEVKGTRANATNAYSVLAEMTTSRLQTCRQPVLTVTRTSDGKEVIPNLPILDYFLMDKGELKRHVEDDEYLDRQDDYSMIFVMHEDGTWYRADLNILSWREVNDHVDL